MNRFAGKTVFITGVGSGMGLESARRLAQAGAHIVGFDRSSGEARRAEIAAQCRDASQRVALFNADVADREGIRRAIDKAVAAVGKPDIVIHMAAAGGLASMMDMPFETFDRTMQVNVYGTRHLVEACVPHMVGRTDGTRPILALAASMGGFVPVYGYTAYGTSKFAVVGFARCLRYELKPLGVDVACFCPAQVDTPGLAWEQEQSHPAARALKLMGGTIAIEKAVAGLLQGLQQRKFLIVPGWRARMVHLALRLTPDAWWNAITDAIVAKALRTAAKP